MDVGLKDHQAELQRRMLLFGVVVYAAGQLGAEPVRSQGHVHAIAPHCGWSTPEIFEIWEGRAIIYAQQFVAEDPGICVAIYADPGDKIVVPPGWAHYVVNADCTRPMVFAAWCDRQYGFVYDEIRKRHGLAWFPILDSGKAIRWEPNPAYRTADISTRNARDYPELKLKTNLPIYQQFGEDPQSLQWVSQPALMSDLWGRFEM
jgi:glucose-6-phosphate isomerase